MDNTRAKRSLPVVLFVVDVEARGKDILLNGLNCVGAVAGLLSRVELLHKCRFNLGPLDGQVYEERCISEFWYDKLHWKEEIDTNPIDPMVAIGKFRDALDNLDRQYNVVVVSDNSGFDIAYINYYLAQAKRPPLQYRANGSYRGSTDCYDFIRGKLDMNFDGELDQKAIIDKYQLPVDRRLHDHHPDNDAEYIYRFTVSLLAALDRIKGNPVEQALRLKRLM